MKNKRWISILFVVVFCLLSVQVLAPLASGEEPTPGETGASGQSSAELQQQIQQRIRAGTLGPFPPEFSQDLETVARELSARYSRPISVERLEKFPSGSGIAVSPRGRIILVLGEDGWDAQGNLESSELRDARKNKRTICLNCKKGRAQMSGTSDDDIQVDFPDNGGATFYGSGYEITEPTPNDQGMMAAFASFARTGNGLLTVTDGEDLEVYYDRIKVGRAAMVSYGCVTFYDVVNAEFIASPSEVRMTTSSILPVKITDCAKRQLTFTAFGEGSYIAIAGDEYSIGRGALNCSDAGRVDKMEANESAIISMAASCFECLLINPIGSYYYYDGYIREKDFAVRIPKDGKKGYKLCLRRFAVQKFLSYDGLADLVEKRMKLNGVAQYKRYPLKNGMTADILTEVAYEGRTAGVKANITLFQDLIFVDTISLTGINATEARNSSRTVPNNFLTFTEEIIAGVKKRIASLNFRLLRAQLTQPLPSLYKTDTDLPPLNITSGAVVQDNGRHRVTILPPDDPRIKEIVG